MQSGYLAPAFPTNVFIKAQNQRFSWDFSLFDFLFRIILFTDSPHKLCSPRIF